MPDAAPSHDGSRPARQADIDQLADATKASFDRVEHRLDAIEATMATKEDLARLATKEDLTRFATKEDLARVERVQESVLNVVESIDERLKGASDHGDRIERLEDTVFAPGRR